MTHPAYGQPRQVTPLAAVVLARNPGPMTLEGTNTWVLRAPGTRQTIVVDPGPDDEEHRRAVVDAAGQVVSILLTHGHFDHSEGARRLPREASHLSSAHPIYGFAHCNTGVRLMTCLLETPWPRTHRPRT